MPNRDFFVMSKVGVDGLQVNWNCRTCSREYLQLQPRTFTYMTCRTIYLGIIITSYLFGSISNNNTFQLKANRALALPPHYYMNTWDPPYNTGTYQLCMATVSKLSNEKTSILWNMKLWRFICVQKWSYSVADLGEQGTPSLSVPLYHPQRSCDKVMFLHLSVIIFTEGRERISVQGSLCQACRQYAFYRNVFLFHFYAVFGKNYAIS